MLSTTFASLQIKEELLGRLQAKEIVTPTPIQAEAIPAALAGRDVLAGSQTGTGKTLAYLLPLLMNIDKDQRTTQAVVVAPTQELAMQIAREAEYYCEGSGIQTAALIGGAALKRQVEKLKERPQLVIGTPGRIRELIEMRKLKMHEVRTIVVDEVDHVLQKGGARDTESIMQSALRDRQLLFFSATLPTEVKTLAERWMREPQHIGIEPEKRIADTIQHLVFVSEERDKIDTLRRLVRHWNPKQAIVFVNDMHQIGEWEAKLAYVGLSVASLYGDAPKQERVNVIRRFREGQFQLLVATDIAARGLDIPELPYVFSVQPALDAEHYVHRAGRTGRMGRRGTSVNIITSRERFIMRKFERELGIVIQERAYYDGRIYDPNDKRVAKPTRSRPRVSANDSEPRSKGERHHDRKNKGAPKWLKEKRQTKK
ncbi:DEAD/DEAH box helicase [Paenibacillus apiarius]|uniref:DEAD/DEAH box helicase n=1 Tax=Paenibacillus apiarius TaxID=46240 RepID=A0ABT4DYB6_9BACL|nr:DEAD/DEAH box helicase [Paenibacillus apiarius]MBN3525551.1 DEAD/DEAH box helicase [Paenibacillus apiarius]MCY9512600.1 DEAD/DEAH box helicase [Paenibacillus apiarius]MCY9522357.1 DEAD/DEAH box helicase [Paenibacillus apiarius]MCY9553679.1 DEAD/DEAH box helicase [Paenibacillus apiarius]MCY9556622.1 DEAD/DEAH box helicase [Paenibacillus apiarius]